MTDIPDSLETLDENVSWSCGLCNANGRQANGNDRLSLEIHMNDHVMDAVVLPVQLVIDLRVARHLIPPSPVLVDVAAYGAGYAVAGVGSAVVVATCEDVDTAEYLARLWNEDHS